MRKLLSFNNKTISNLFVYGLVHMLVDGACAAVIFGGIAKAGLKLEDLALLVILYNMLAFGLQLPFGELVDLTKRPKLAALWGCTFVIFSVIFYSVSLLSVILAGIGNALFHVGGGVVSLRLSPGRAKAPGIFVAPGAMGLLIGTLYGRGGGFSPVYTAVVMLAGSVFIAALEEIEAVPYNRESLKMDKSVGLIVLVISFSVCLRSLIGFMLNYPWKSEVSLLLCFTISVVLGKALGGVLSDRFGWTRVTVIGLLTASILLFMGTGLPILAFIGVFLFNLTMPVTLTAISNLLPGRPGFSFGITTVALLLGAIPSFTSLRVFLFNRWMILTGSLLMAFILYLGLGLYNISLKNSKEQGITL